MQRYASLRQGLVGCWCPSVSGPYGYRLPDLSGYGNHGTLTNMDPGTDWVIDKGKGALDFDGVNDYVVVSHKAMLKSNSQAMSFWMYPSELPSTGYDNIISIYTNNNNTFEFLINNNSSTLAFGSVTWQFSYALPSQKWYHVYGEVVSNGTSGPGKLYVDGVLVDGAGTVSYTGAANTANIEIGRRSSTYCFPGKLDDIRLYRRTLSEPEIVLLASGRGVGLIPERQRNRYSAPAPTSRNRSSRFLSFPA